MIFKQLLTLSLKELTQLSVNPPAAITSLPTEESPAKITVISASDIRLSPARNIYDLIEIYVPGAFWMNHEEGPSLGMHGLISSRNNKYLLRLNDRVLNNKAQFGAKPELEQWNIDDIQHIEVIRGSGSVTYGPGAVAGVINIYTHTADSFTGQKISTRFINEYNSVSTSYNYGSMEGDHKFFTHLSIVKTKGNNARQFIVTNKNEAGFIGEKILLQDEPLDYFSDYQDQPQIKFHLDTETKKNNRFRVHYTQQGTRDRQFTAAFEYKEQLRKNLSLVSTASIDSFDSERRRSGEKNPVPDNIINFRNNFSETKLFMSNQLNYIFNKKIEIAY